jgi:3-oxoacyl-[acyl-carrier protein] reductase
VTQPLVDLDLHGRHALVTGASRGIGRAAALAIGSLGAQVTALARDRHALEDLRAALAALGAPDPDIWVGDLEDHAALATGVTSLIQARGPVHILVANAAGPPRGRLLDATPDDFQRAFQRHLYAFHLLVQALVPGMASAGYGRIVTVASTSIREPIPGLGVGNTLRGALAAWAKTLSDELPPGVAIHTLMPGFTDTERLASLAQATADAQGTTPEAVRKAWSATTPEGRIGRPEELGAVIAFLVSPAASYMRGSCIAVDGGRLRSV